MFCYFFWLFVVLGLCSVTANVRLPHLINTVSFCYVK